MPYKYPSFRPRPSEKLIERLNAEMDCRIDTTIHKFRRLRPGYHQRSAGAWSWEIHGDGMSIGSPDPVSVCLKAKTLSFGPFGTIYCDDK